MGQGPRIEEWDLGSNHVEAYYTEYPYSAMAIQPDLRNSTKQARELEAHGYYRRPPRSGRKFCFAPRHAHDFDDVAIGALRSVVDDLQPSWVEEVKDATRMSNDVRWIAAWCELSPNVVVAIIENLKARGELPGG